MRYGTVMIARGFEDEWVLGDAGTVVMAVRFASKDEYAVLADDRLNPHIRCIVRRTSREHR